MSIETCIESLFRIYWNEPLALMREIGIQAQLRQLLHDAFVDKTCRTQVRIGDAMLLAPSATSYLTERVQMEVRVTSADGRGSEKSDIVVFRSTVNQDAMPITVTRHAEGSFDIISKIAISDVAAVIEVKAACSADFEQRHRFRRDLDKLLRIGGLSAAQPASPDLHFVLIDKSVAISHGNDESYGVVPVETAMPRLDWHNETEEFLNKQTELNKAKFWTNSPKPVLCDKRPATRPFVHVWYMDHQNGIASACNLQHRFAVYEC